MSLHAFPSMSPIAPRACLVAFVLAALGALAAGDPGLAQEPRSRSRLEENRRRWQSLPEDRKQQLAELHRRLRQLPAAEQQRLLDRLGKLDARQRQAALEQARDRSRPGDVDRDLERERRKIARREAHRLPPPVRERLERLERLPPGERDRAVRELIAEESRKRLERAPPRLRERLERLPPEEQLRTLLRMRDERTAARVFADPAEVNRLRSLPHRQVLRALRVEPAGPRPRRPDFLSERTWGLWLELKPHERPGVLRAVLRPERERPDRPERPDGREPGPGGPRHRPPDKSKGQGGSNGEGNGE